jgi:hypothetical protein
MTIAEEKPKTRSRRWVRKHSAPVPTPPRVPMQATSARQIVAQRRFMANLSLDRETMIGISDSFKDVRITTEVGKLTALSKGVERYDEGHISASAAVINDQVESPDAVPPPSATRQWQTDAWGFYDLVGELGNAARLYANCFRRTRLVAALVSDDGQVSTTFDDEAPEKATINGTTAVIKQLEGAYTSQEGLMERFGSNTFMVGECFLYRNDILDGHPGTWEVLSTDELRPISSGTGYASANPATVRWVRYYGPGFNPRYLPKDAYICRIWRPHPRYSRHANSSVRPLLEILDEIVLLTREVRGETVSRLSSAGLLALAQEMDFPNSDDAQPGTEDMDPFTREFLNTAMIAITEKSSAAGVAPMVLRAPAELIDKGIKYISFARPDAAIAMGKRREALERFAQGIELPPEWTFGHASTTFANAFQITEDAFRIYIEPGLSEVCEALTIGYLWPQLMLQAGLDPNEPVPDEIRRQRIWYDASHLIAKPDRSADAKMAFDAMAISWEALRHVTGFVEEDKPNDQEVAIRIRLAQELNQRVTIRGTDVNLPVVVDPALLQLENQPGNQATEFPFPDGSDPYEQPPPNTPLPTDVDPVTGLPRTTPVASPAAAAPAPAQPPGSAPLVASAHPVGILAIRLHSAAEHAVEKAVDKVGARLRSLARARDQLSGVSNAMVAAELGSEAVLKLLGPDPLAGEFASFSRLASGWAAEHGARNPAALAVWATRQVEETAYARLYDPTRIVDLAAFSLLVDEQLLELVAN